MRATVITDASWCPKTGAGGWAAWIAGDGFPEKIKKAGRLKEPAASAEDAELRALINGMTVAYRAGGRVLLMQTDCLALVTKGLKHPEIAKARKLHAPDAYLDFRHVKGHTSKGEARYWVNRWCDENAKKHMRDMRHELQNTAAGK